MKSTKHSGILYVVATPIGNLEDISKRALRILDEVFLIAAEDTRQTRKILSHYGLKTRLTSCHGDNEKKKATEIIDVLQSGKDVALVSNAGTPTLSDPGGYLVRLTQDAGIDVRAIPGPCALPSALSVSGINSGQFVFHGFLPTQKSKRINLLEGAAKLRMPQVIFESANRLESLLEIIAELTPAREVALVREISKIYEECLRGKVDEILSEIREEPLKGEMVVILGPLEEETQKEVSPTVLRRASLIIKEYRIPVKNAAALLAVALEMPKQEIYRRLVEYKNNFEFEP